jgi:phage tail sheath gpL-like
MTIDVTARARATGVAATYKNFAAGSIQNVPQKIVVIGQGTTVAATANAYPNTKQRITTRSDAAQFGYGSPMCASLEELFPVFGDGAGTVEVYAIGLDDAGGGVVATGTITVTVGTIAAPFAFRARIGGVLSDWVSVTTTSTPTTIAAALDVAIDAVVRMPVIASPAVGVVTLTAKWKGVTGNDIAIEVVDVPNGSGVTFAVANMSSGATNPGIDTALALIPEDDTTIVVNLLGEDATALPLISTWGEARRTSLVNRPAIAVYGDRTLVPATAATTPDSRKTDRTNVKVNVPGTPSPSWIVATEAARQIAVTAQSNPAYGYSLLPLNVIPGASSDQHTYAERDLLVKAGCSTTELRDGVIVLSDVVTMWHPTGEDPPAHAKVETWAKLLQITGAYRDAFDTREWASAPIIAAGQATTNPAAKSTGSALALSAKIIDSAALQALIADPKWSKANQTCEINSQNPDRLDLRVPVKLSGNGKIYDTEILFGFYYGA